MVIDHHVDAVHEFALDRDRACRLEAVHHILGERHVLVKEGSDVGQEERRRAIANGLPGQFESDHAATSPRWPRRRIRNSAKAKSSSESISTARSGGTSTARTIPAKSESAPNTYAGRHA